MSFEAAVSDPDYFRRSDQGPLYSCQFQVTKRVLHIPGLYRNRFTVSITGERLVKSAANLNHGMPDDFFSKPITRL